MGLWKHIVNLKVYVNVIIIIGHMNWLSYIVFNLN